MGQVIESQGYPKLQNGSENCPVSSLHPIFHFHMSLKYPIQMVLFNPILFSINKNKEEWEEPIDFVNHKGSIKNTYIL